MSDKLIRELAIKLTTAVAIIVGGCNRPTVETSQESKQNAEQAAAAPLDQVLLSAAAKEAANIRTQVAALQEVPDIRVVPGRLQYDDRRHVKVRVATASVVVQIDVKPGDRVTKGQTLAVISSPELGEARADVLKRKAELTIAQRKYHWEAQIETNLRPLVSAIQKHAAVAELQKQFSSTVLGESREKLFSAYTRFALADSLLKNADSANTAGVLATRTIQERTSERQAAEAALQAACEQATFDAEQHRDQAALIAADAQRRSDISSQHLRTLLGYDPIDNSAEKTTDKDLSLAEVKAPFAGTIERRSFSTSERVQPNDELFVLADTTTLWMVADVREQDWMAINLPAGTPVSVHIPAIPDRQFTAKIHFIGREVSTDSNAISIVAEMENPDAILRPGLYVQATINLGSTTPILVVPAAAIVTHNQQSFVFVQAGDNTFRRVNVTAGRKTDDWVEIQKGLQAGDPVVIQGAFTLKSELLLEPEE